MALLTENLCVFRYLDGAAGFRIGRTYFLRYEVFQDGSVLIERESVVGSGHPRPGAGPLVLSAEKFRKWFEPVG